MDCIKKKVVQVGIHRCWISEDLCDVEVLEDKRRGLMVKVAPFKITFQQLNTDNKNIHLKFVIYNKTLLSVNYGQPVQVMKIIFLKFHRYLYCNI